MNSLSNRIRVYMKPVPGYIRCNMMLFCEQGSVGTFAVFFIHFGQRV